MFCSHFYASVDLTFLVCFEKCFLHLLLNILSSSDFFFSELNLYPALFQCHHFHYIIVVICRIGAWYFVLIFTREWT